MINIKQFIKSRGAGAWSNGPDSSFYRGYLVPCGCVGSNPTPCKLLKLTFKNLLAKEIKKINEVIIVKIQSVFISSSLQAFFPPRYLFN
jgi:predicted Abi (CAAX) family protease